MKRDRSASYTYFKALAASRKLRVFKSGRVVSDEVFTLVTRGRICLQCKKTRRRVDLARLMLYLFTKSLPARVRFLDGDSTNCSLDNIEPRVALTTDAMLRLLRGGASVAAIAEASGASKESVRRRIGSLSDETSPYFEHYKKTVGHAPLRKLTDLERAQVARFTTKQRNNDKRRTKIWTLKYEDIHWPTHCPILGLELDYFATSATPNSPSFDRIDSNKGYVKGNVAVISYRANVIKNDGTADEHRAVAKYIESRLKRRT